MAFMVGGLDKVFGIKGEEENKRLAVLVATSRLLEKPLGAIVRGPAGCGKSALISAVAKLLPPYQVLNFSRMTAQSLYFLPKDALKNKLLVCDEYEGMSDSEYALRSLMSSQMLSLAITVREGGRTPTTQIIEIPASVAVLVSTTQSINAENLSRFIELGMDASPEQTARVMESMTDPGKPESVKQERLKNIHNLNQYLRPCSVEIPFANELLYISANVLARRQFSHIVGLISAHAALFQRQRETRESEDGKLTVVATKDDYAAVHKLIGSIADHFEDSLSPASVSLLKTIKGEKRDNFTIKMVMRWMGWSYSKTYRVLQELTAMDLVIPDKTTNGTERKFQATPYTTTDRGINQLAPPAL